MHDRITSFCPACETRVPPGPKCPECGSEGVRELRDPETGGPLLSASTGRRLREHEHRLLQEAPSVRAAARNFAIGVGVTVTVPLALPVFAGWPLAGLVLAASAFLGGGAVGALIARTAPRSLLGVNERDQLEAELVELSARLSVPVAGRRQRSTVGLETWHGRIDGVPAPSPLRDEPVLAAQLTGTYGQLTVDDAWVAPGGLVFVRAGARDGEPELRIPLEPDAGLWLDGRVPESLREIRPELESFFAARGAGRPEHGLEVARGLLKVASLRPGNEVRVTGRASLRKVSDGYRGSSDVPHLEGPFFLQF